MCRSVTVESIQIKFCTLTLLWDVVLCTAQHLNWFRGFREVECKIWPFPLTSALASNTVYCITVHMHDIVLSYCRLRYSKVINKHSNDNSPQYLSVCSSLDMRIPQQVCFNWTVAKSTPQLTNCIIRDKS